MIDKIENIVEESLEQATGKTVSDTGGISIFSWLVYTGDTLPPWWSRTRDRELGQVWKESNHLSLAVYNAQAKIVGIPFEVIPLNVSNADHLKEAEQLTETLHLASEFGRGWDNCYSKFIEDVLCSDNGGFLEIVGEGNPDGPIEGKPIAMRHLDSRQCIRTGDPTYPVLYTDGDGKLYKLNWARVIAISQMPSSRVDMNGVGFCAISRCVEVARTLVDILRYKQERLGSRPHNQMLVGKGITAKQIMLALRQVEDELSSKGLTKYAKTVAIGSENPEIGIDKIDLNHFEPFDESVSFNLGMFAIASAFGMDADELWPTGGSSANKVEANIRRMRTRGRLPAQITSEMTKQFKLKVLPPHLKVQFDFRDDEEDQQQAVVRDIRGRNRERDLGTGSVNIRVARLNMLKDGDVSRDEFNYMELSDGRMPDGTSISILFFTPDPVYDRYLHFVPNPLVYQETEFDQAIDKIQQSRQKLLSEMATTESGKKRDKLQLAFFALDWVEEQYGFAHGRILPPVPMQRRSSRTDIRVAPVEVSPPQGEQSPAQADQAAGGGEDVPNVGAE